MTLQNTKLILLALSIVVALTLPSCGIQSQPMAVTSRGDTLEVRGVIDAETLATLKTAQSQAPDIRTLSLVNVPGSVDDNTSLTVLAAYVRGNNFSTVVPANGMVASGGTDMALMGTPRIIEDGACIGVHSWASETLFRTKAGSGVPRADPQHRLYLDFYNSVGVPEAFYWYTLEVAGPDDIHWMSPSDINRFGLSQIPLRTDIAETALERKIRCDAL